MGNVIKIDDALWTKLPATARRAGRTPEGVVRGLICKFLEVEVDRELDAAIAKDLQSSGYEEGDAVRLVREYGTQVRSKPAGKVSEAPRRYPRERRG